MNITERLEAGRADLEKQELALEELKEVRDRWRFFYGEGAIGAVVGIGEVSLTLLRSRASSDMRKSPGWSVVQAGWRIAEVMVGAGIAILKDKSLSYRIEDAESQLDWDTRQINRVVAQLDRNWLDYLYKEVPMFPGG